VGIRKKAASTSIKADNTGSAKEERGKMFAGQPGAIIPKEGAELEWTPSTARIIQDAQKEMLSQNQSSEFRVYLEDLCKLEEPSELMEEAGAADEASIMRARKEIQDRMSSISEEHVQTTEIVVEVQPEISVHQMVSTMEVSNPSLVDSILVQLNALSTKAKLFAVTMSFLSGYLGGFCGIGGPPIMMFFLHAGSFDLEFTKTSQRATGAALTFCNVAVRVFFYALASTDADANEDTKFVGGDYPMYVSVGLCSFSGACVGQLLFKRMKDSQATIEASNPGPRTPMTLL
jgi:hypothetical protein